MCKRFRTGYLAADEHPDHDTIANFRRQHLQALARFFVEALQLCRKAGLVKLDNATGIAIALERFTGTAGDIPAASVRQARLSVLSRILSSRLSTTGRNWRVSGYLPPSATDCGPASRASHYAGRRCHPVPAR